jgi:rubredoxin
MTERCTWIYIDRDAFRFHCDRCGSRYSPNLGVPASEFLEDCEQFENIHRKFKEKTN